MDVDQLIGKALEIYKIKDSFSAIVFLCGLADPQVTMNAFTDHSAGFDAARVNLRLAIELE